MKSLFTTLWISFGAYVGYWLGSVTGNQFWACLLLSVLGFALAGFIRYAPNSITGII